MFSFSFMKVSKSVSVLPKPGGCARLCPIGVEDLLRRRSFCQNGGRKALWELADVNIRKTISAPELHTVSGKHKEKAELCLEVAICCLVLLHDGCMPLPPFLCLGLSSTYIVEKKFVHEFHVLQFF